MLIQTRAAARAQAAQQKFMNGRVTRQKAQEMEKSCKLFRLPEARKGKITSRLEAECRKNDSNSNRGHVKVNKQKTLEPPQTLQEPESVHETDSYEGSNPGFPWLKNHPSPRATPLSLFSKTNHTLGHCDRESTVTGNLGGILELRHLPETSFAAVLSQ